jgi:hypothetical protein
MRILEMIAVRFSIAVALPFFLLMDRFLDGQPFSESMAYYKRIWKEGAL